MTKAFQKQIELEILMDKLDGRGYCSQFCNPKDDMPKEHMATIFIWRDDGQPLYTPHNWDVISLFCYKEGFHAIPQRWTTNTMTLGLVDVSAFTKAIAGVKITLGNLRKSYWLVQGHQGAVVICDELSRLNDECIKMNEEFTGLVHNTETFNDHLDNPRLYRGCINMWLTSETLGTTLFTTQYMSRDDNCLPINKSLRS